jgi:hypothetical protein
MRTLFRLFTLILCVELIVSPMNPSLSLIAQEVFAQGNCPAGLKYDSVLNRCLSTEEATKVMNATAQCASGDVNCYKANAQDLLQEQVNKGAAPERKGNNGFVSTVANIGAIAGPVTYAVIGMSTSNAKCSSPSFWAMVGGAAALVIGDNLANLQHKKRLKKIKEDWGKIVNPEDAAGDKDKQREASINAQSEAFEMLARSEDSLAQAAKMKKNFFMIATLAYGVSGTLSLLEIIKEKSLKTAAMSAIATAKGTAAGTPGTAADIAASGVAVTGAVTKSASTDAISQATPAPAASADAATTLGSIEAAAAAIAKSAVLAQTEAAAISAASLGAGAAAAQASATNTQAAAAATRAWALHKQTTMCIPLGVTAQHKVNHFKSIYSYYTEPGRNEIKEELQFLSNLKNSKDLVSFILNKKEMDGELDDPLREYEIHKKNLSFLEPEREIFESFKFASLFIMNSLNPISLAYAKDEKISSEVDTNAAHAFKEDKAKGIDLLSIGLGVGIGVLLATKLEVGKKLITSKGRLIFSGVMAGLTLVMANHAGSQAEASKKRAELLRKMKNEFQTVAGAIYACKTEDRNDPGKPNCYCYTAENGRNPNRSNSQVCQKLWSGIDMKPTNYATATESTKICVNNQNKSDPTCACKKTKTCMKVGLNGMKGFNTGTMSMLSSSLQPLNGITNGSVDGATIDSASLANQAARVTEFNKQLEKNPLTADIFKDISKNEKALLSKLQNGAGGLGSSGFLGGSPASGLPSNAGDAARMLEKELDSVQTPTGVDGGDFLATPSNESTEPAQEFGLTQDELTAQEAQIAQIMKEELDYGGNDINEGSKQNIFEVLSNRYQRSGMRRLFEEGTPAPTAPADVTQK